MSKVLVLLGTILCLATAVADGRFPTRRISCRKEAAARSGSALKKSEVEGKEEQRKKNFREGYGEDDCSYHHVQQSGHFHGLTNEPLTDDELVSHQRRFMETQRGRKSSQGGKEAGTSPDEEEEDDDGEEVSSEGSSYYSVTTKARVHKDWHFVQLEDHFPAGAPLVEPAYRVVGSDKHHTHPLLQGDTRINCSSARVDTMIRVQHRAALHGTDDSYIDKLHASLQEKGYQHTILLSDGHHCAGDPVFRRVHRVTHLQGVETVGRMSPYLHPDNHLFGTRQEKKRTLHIETSFVSYQDIFESADVSFVAYNPPTLKSPMSRSEFVPGTDEAEEGPGEPSVVRTAIARRHAMQQQQARSVNAKKKRTPGNQLNKSEKREKKPTLPTGAKRFKNTRPHVRAMALQSAPSGSSDPASVPSSDIGSQSDGPPLSNEGSGIPSGESQGGNSLSDGGLSDSQTSGSLADGGSGGGSSLPGDLSGSVPDGGPGSQSGGSLGSQGASSQLGDGSDLGSLSGGGDLSAGSTDGSLSDAGLDSQSTGSQPNGGSSQGGGSDDGSFDGFPSSTGGGDSLSDDGDSLSNDPTGSDSTTPTTSGSDTTTPSGVSGSTSASGSEDGEGSDDDGDGSDAPPPAWWGDGDEPATVRSVASSFDSAEQAQKKLESEEGNSEQLSPNPDQETSNMWASSHMNFNGDVTKNFKNWNILSTNNIGLSFDFKGKLVFKMKVAGYEMEDLEAFWEGHAKTGVKGNFDALYQKGIVDYEKTDPVQSKTYSFKIAGVPVTINPSVDLYCGYDLQVDGPYPFNVVFSGEGFVKQGIVNNTKTGFQPVAVSQMDYVKDISPRDYKSSVGLSLYTGANYRMDISFMGGPRNAVRMNGLMFLSQTKWCNVMTQFEIQEVQAYSALVQIDLQSVRVGGRAFFIPPLTVAIKIVPIYTMCYPTPNAPTVDTRQLALESRRMKKQQECDGDCEHSFDFDGDGGDGGNGGAATLPVTPVPQAGVNTGKILITPLAKLTVHEAGLVWNGFDDGSFCSYSQSVSVQFVIGPQPGTALYVLVVNTNTTERDPDTRKYLPSTYMQSNIITFSHAQPRENSGKITADIFSNETIFVTQTTKVRPVTLPEKEVYVTFHRDGADKLTVQSEKLFCGGSVQLSTTELTNTNLSFGLLVQAAPAPQTLRERLQAIINLILTFVPSIFLCLCSATALFCMSICKGRDRRHMYRDFRQRREMYSAVMGEFDDDVAERRKGRTTVVSQASTTSHTNAAALRTKSGMNFDGGDIGDAANEEMRPLATNQSVKAEDRVMTPGGEKSGRSGSSSSEDWDGYKGNSSSPSGFHVVHQPSGPSYPAPTDDPEGSGVYMPPVPAFLIAKKEPGLDDL